MQRTGIFAHPLTWSLFHIFRRSDFATFYPRSLVTGDHLARWWVVVLVKPGQSCPIVTSIYSISTVESENSEKGPCTLHHLLVKVATSAFSLQNLLRQYFKQTGSVSWGPWKCLSFSWHNPNSGWRTFKVCVFSNKCECADSCLQKAEGARNR